MLDPKTVAEAKAAGWVHLAVRCEACKRETAVPWDRLSHIGLIASIPDRLKCRECGAGQPTVWPWMDSRDLKRLQRMVRS